MLESIINSVELQPKREIPSQTAIVGLPEVELFSIGIDGIRKIRLAMHTDNIVGTLRALKELPELSEIYIEGRVISPEQKIVLTNHPVYRFFINGRVHRTENASNEDILAYLVPKDTGLDPNEIPNLLSASFTPSDFSEQIGFTVGFYKATDLINAWISGQVDSSLIPLLGAVNEFRIGSDTLSQEQLERISRYITNSLGAEQVGVLNKAHSIQPKLQSNYFQIPLTNSFSKTQNLSFRDNKITENIIKIDDDKEKILNKIYFPFVINDKIETSRILIKEKELDKDYFSRLYTKSSKNYF